MICGPAETIVDAEGRVALPLDLLAEAGLDPDSKLLAFGDGDGRIVLEREADALDRAAERRLALIRGPRGGISCARLLLPGHGGAEPGGPPRPCLRRRPAPPPGR